MVTTLQEEYLCHNGAKLYYRQLVPENNRLGTVILVHGLGEHSGRHQSLANYLTEQGYHLVLFDLRGFGRSGGLKGHVDKFSDYLDDLLQIIRITSQEKPILLGHSFGGLVVTSFALNYPEAVKGIILSSPALAPKIQPPAWKEFLARKLLAIAPKLRLPHGISANKLSHDPKVAPEYRQDPLCYPKVSTTWYQQFKLELKNVNERAPHLTVPVLIIQGEADSIVNPEGVKEFYSRLHADLSKKLVCFPEAYHEVFKEKCDCREQALQEVVQWLKGLYS